MAGKSIKKKSTHNKHNQNKLKTKPNYDREKQVHKPAKSIEDIISSSMVQLKERINMFTIHKCKREEYIKAWNYMYSHHKSEINSSELYNDVNPSLNDK